MTNINKIKTIVEKYTKKSLLFLAAVTSSLAFCSAFFKWFILQHKLQSYQTNVSHRQEIRWKEAQNNILVVPCSPHEDTKDHIDKGLCGRWLVCRKHPGVSDFVHHGRERWQFFVHSKLNEGGNAISFTLMLIKFTNCNITVSENILRRKNQMI